MRRSLGISEQPAPELEIQRMRRRHLKGVMAIERQVYPRPWSPNLFLAEMNETRDRLYLVARVDRDVVGYGGLMVNGDEGHVTTIAVDPEWQRHKIGTRLLVFLARESLRRGARNLTLEVRVSNEPAQGMYRQFGFKPAGIRKGYYQETNEDALVMWAEDIDTDEYAERLARLEAGVPGTTVIEDFR